MDVAAMKQGSVRYPPTIWFLGCVLAVLLGLLLLFAFLLVERRTENAATAFATGRFVKVVVATGEMESKVPSSHDNAAPAAMNRDSYKEQRLKQLTVHMSDAPPVKESIAEGMKTEASTPEIKNAETTGKTISLPPRKVTFPLKPAPNAALIDRLTNGQTLPIISADGSLKPWQEYAKPYPLPREPHLLSLVITNLGMNAELFSLTRGLDERITLAFSPYAPSLRDNVKAARAAGFETWVNLPLQHEHYPVHDYGALTLIAQQTPEQNLASLRQVMAGADGVVGMIAMPDEQFSGSAQMAPVFAELTKRGLLLTLYNPSFTPLANQAMLLHARPHIYSATMPATIQAFFHQNETLASSTPHTILTLAPMPAVMQQLNGWIATLPARGIALVPLSMQVEETPRSQTVPVSQPAGKAHE